MARHYFASLELGSRKRGKDRKRGHLSLISLSFVSKSTSVLGSRIKTCLFNFGKEISSYPTSKTSLSVEQICSHHALLRHMQVWSPLWQTSEGAHQNKAWWPCAHLWEVWKYMQRREEAKDTHGVSQGNYMQTLPEAQRLSLQLNRMPLALVANLANM